MIMLNMLMAMCMGSLDRGLNPEPNSRVFLCRVESSVLRRHAGPYRVCAIVTTLPFGVNINNYIDNRHPRRPRAAKHTSSFYEITVAAASTGRTRQ